MKSFGSIFVKKALFLVFSMLCGQAQAQVVESSGCVKNIKDLHAVRDNYVELPREGIAEEKDALRAVIEAAEQNKLKFDSSEDAFKSVEDLKEQLISKQDFVLSSGDASLEHEYYSALVDLEYFLLNKRDATQNTALMSRIKRWAGNSKLLGAKNLKIIKSKAVDRELEAQLSLIRSRGRATFANEKSVQSELQHFFFLKYMRGDARSLEILDWLARNPEHEMPKQWRQFRELTSYVDKRFQRNKTVLKEGATKAEAKTLLRQSQEKYLEQYNGLVEKKISEFKTLKEFQREVAQYVLIYSRIDENFRVREFYSWLRETGEPSEQYFKTLKERAKKKESITLGTFVKNRYEKFTPYAKQDPYADKKFIDAWTSRAKASFGKIKSEWDSCDDRKCQFELFQSRFTQLFDPRAHKDKFSCMFQNPVVLKSTAMDIAVYWGALFAYFNSNKDRLDRFPFEAIASTIIFTPIFAEANCRISFKSDLKFGKTLSKTEVFPGGKVKAQRFAKKLAGLSGKTAISTIAFVGFTHGFDHIFLAMGGTLSFTPDLAKSLQTIPFIFLHSAVWANARRTLIQNPIRYKLLPKIAQKLSQKIKLPKSSPLLLAGLDFGTYFYMSKFNSWEYFTLYREQVMPWLMGLFGLTAVVPNGDPKKADELNQEVKDSYKKQAASSSAPAGASPQLPEAEITVKEDEKFITVERNLDNGVKASTTLEKLPEGKVQLYDVDLEIPDEILDQLIEALILEEFLSEEFKTEEP